MSTAKASGMSVRDATVSAVEMLSEFIDGAISISAVLERRADGTATVHVAVAGCDCRGCRDAMIGALREFADGLERGVASLDRNARQVH